MANTVFKLRRSSVAGKVPNTSTLSIGELGINLTDKILYSSDGSSVFEIGANITSLSVTNSLTLNNDKNLYFKTVNTSAGVIFKQQSDDNFVMYSTNTSYGQRPVWSIFANSITSAFSFSVPTQFNNWVNLNSQTVYANGSSGSAGQVLASNGSATYWVSPGVASVNTSAQYTWTNTHTFQANVSFTGSGLAVNSNTGSVYFGGISDANWRISRNAGVTTKYFYTNNTLDIIAASSPGEGIVFGWTGNSYLETGYAGTFTRLPIYVGNSSVNTTINATSFTGTANNSLYLGGTAAASYVQNTDSRTLSGNLTYTGANLVILGTNTYITSNVLINGVASFKSINGQSNASGGNFINNAYATLGGAGGNYLAFGQQTNFSQWIQSGYSAASPVYYDIIINPLGGNTGIGNTLPNHKLSVNGSTYFQGQVTFTQGITDSTGVQGNPGNILTSNGSGNVYWSSTANNATNLNAQPASYYTNATNINTGTLPYAQLGNNVVNTTSAFTFSGVHTYNANIVLGSSGLSANGSYGSAGEILHSNGSSVYWATDDQGVTSVITGSGLTGGPITSNGTVSVLANNGITANTTGLFVTQGTGTVVNSSGVHVNSTYIGTLSSNSATYLGNSSGTIANVSSWITTNASAAYTNAVSYTDSKIATANAAITGNAATAYSNAVSYTDSKIATANSAITGNAATAYTNAIAFASNASNINTGTLAEARLPYRLNQNLTTSNNVTFGSLTLTGNLTVSGNVTVIGANTLSIVDNMIYLNSNNTTQNIDVGIVANYNSGGYAHTGIFRDASDGYWKVFDSYLPEPDANVNIDTTNTSFHLADFQANSFYAGNTSTNWFIANTTGAYHIGLVNAASYRVGTSFTANSTLTNTVSLVVSTNTATIGTGTYFVSNGNVGIGNTTPDHKLIVQRAAGLSTLGEARFTDGTYWSMLNTRQNPGTYNSLVQSGDHTLIYSDGSIDTGAFVIAQHSNSTRGIRIDASGNVGIGTTSPSYKLDVAGTINGLSSAGGVNGVKVTATGGYDSWLNFYRAGYVNWYIGTLNNSTRLDILNDSLTAMSVAANGNVGIGTTAPSAKLQISNAGSFTAIRATNTTDSVQFDAIASSTAVAIGAATSHPLILNTGNTERMRITSDGNVGIGTTSPASKLHIDSTSTIINDDTVRFQYDNGTAAIRLIGASASPQSIYFGTSTANKLGSFVFDNSNQAFYFTSNASERLRITNTGNIGIGTTSPAYKLEVNGAFAATTKSFVIDHPSKKGMKLRHGSLEGPENGVYVRGRTNTNIIELPDYWVKLIDKDSITVSLTAIGKTVCPSVGKITNKKINLIGDNIDCFFHVFAERKDVEKLVVEY